jgi:hypothetical protein
MVRAILEGRKTQTRRVVDLDRLHGFLPQSVRGDSIFSNIVAEPGKHRLHTNRNFAVSAILPEEKKLGLRPGEFDFLCPYAGQCSAETDGKIWTLTPREPARLWVRESWSGRHEFRDTPPKDRNSFVAPYGPVLREEIWYWADGNIPEHGDWEKPRPSIHMPRYASRILLEVTEVRIERLNEISEKQARAEGVETWEFLEELDRMHSIAPSGIPCTFPTLRDEFEMLWKKINGWESWGKNPWVWAVSFKQVEP